MSSAPVSRRSLLTGTAAAGLLAACGTGAPTAPPTTAAASAAGFPLTVDHAYGSTVIPAPPQRVVSLGYSEQDAVLAVDVVPVGIREWFGRQPYATWEWARDRLGGARPEVLGVGSGLEFEKISALAPDLIMAPLGGILESEYPTLSKIAPTVAHARDVAEYTTPWPELTRTVGRMLGRTDRAEAAIAAVQAKFAATVSAHPQFAGRTAIAAYDFGQTVGVYGPSQDPRGRLLVDLGFTFPPALADVIKTTEFSTEISREQLSLLEADVVIWVIYQESGEEGSPDIETDPLYQEMRVSREGRHVFLRGNDVINAAFSFSSVLSLPVVLDRLVPRIAAAVDGDPATGAA